MRAFKSLQWTQRYYRVGEFELHCDLMFLEALYEGEYIFRKDRQSMGIIEYRQVDNLNNEIIVKGKFLENILQSRVIDTTATYSGKAEDICRRIVSDFCLSGDRAIPNLELGEYKGLGENLSIQHTGKTVLDALCEVLNRQETGFRIKYDLITEKMRFEVYKGADRTQQQSENSWCVFSTDFYNILSEKYEASNDRRNFAYVAGGGEGSDRVVVNVDIRSANEARKELYVDARDLRQESGMTVNEYKKTLYDRGLAKLEEYNISDTVECEIDINKAAYFQLGDKCTYIQPKLGLVLEGRITEIYEVYESGNISTNITLGKEQLTIVEKIKRRV